MIHVIKLKGIVGLEILPLQLEQQLDQLGLSKSDELRFEVNSPGGSVPDGFEIFNMIKNLDVAKKVFEVTGIAMSIMSLIIMSGDEVEASEISMLMIHKASTGLEGNADELVKQADILNKIDEILVELYFKRNQAKGKIKLSREEIMEKLATETWMTPEEARDYGFVDRIVNKSDFKIAAQMKDLILNNRSMKHLERLRKLLALGGRPEITAEMFKEHFAKALGEKKYQDLSEEEAATLAETVKGAIKDAIGAETLTEEEAAQCAALLTAAVEELKATETALTEEEKQKQEEEKKKKEEEYAAINAKLDAQDEVNKEIAQALVATSELMEGIKGEIVALQKGVRTFGKKPIVNNSRINLGETYVDPYAKHRAEMAEIEKKTRQGAKSPAKTA